MKRFCECGKDARGPLHGYCGLCGGFIRHEDPERDERYRRAMSRRTLRPALAFSAVLWAALVCGFLLMTGCSIGAQVGPIVSADAKQASEMATAAGATSRANCYSGWGSLADATSSGKGGILTGVEAGFEVDELINSRDCQAVAGAVIMWALKHAPGGF